jgi:hypothetical protein
LGEGKTGRQVAETLAVTPETVSRWRQDATFEAAINAQLAEARDYAANKLKALTTDALSVIEEILNDSEAKPGERLSAAATVLRLVKGTALLQVGAVGATTPEGVAKQRFNNSIFDF